MRISDWSSDVCSSDLDEAIRIDVDLRQHDALVGIVGGDLFEHGGELLARPAPFGPEIQDDEAGHRRLDDVAPERLDGFLFLRVQAQCGHGMSPRSQRGKQIGRAHVCTPVTNAHLVCRLLLEKKKYKNTSPEYI